MTPLRCVIVLGNQSRAVPHSTPAEGRTKRVGNHSTEEQTLDSSGFQRYVQVLEARLAKLEQLVQQVRTTPSASITRLSVFLFR
jgi:hypothetical protein